MLTATAVPNIAANQTLNLRGNALRSITVVFMPTATWLMLMSAKPRNPKRPAHARCRVAAAGDHLALQQDLHESVADSEAMECRVRSGSLQVIILRQDLPTRIQNPDAETKGGR